MDFLDDVNVSTPTVSAMATAMAKYKFKGKWKINRLDVLVSAYEETTQNAHFFLSHDPDEMAKELWLRDLEIFTGDTWS
jgi:hypothetical protein